MSPDRRPLASRNTQIAQRAAQALTRTSITPNQISQASMVCAALAGGAFWASAGLEGFPRWLALVGAALGCQLRLLCNLLDGMVAVEGKRGSPDGPFWNEAPDRVSDILILVGMGLAVGSPGLGWCAAAIAVLVAYIRELGASNGLAADFVGPMAKPHRMALATGAALLSIGLPHLAGIPLLTLALWVIVLGGLVTASHRSMRVLHKLKALEAKPRSADPSKLD